MKSAALALVFALLAPLAGCASLKPEILCNPYTGQASVVQSVSVVTTKQDIRADRECPQPVKRE